MHRGDRDGRIGPAAPELLRSLLQRLGDLGITRLGDITGLDRIGIPVMQAARPLSLSNSVSQGKGATVEVAALSAILEAAECFFAERVAHFTATTAAAEALAVAPATFARHLTEDCPPSWQGQNIAWVDAEDLVSSSKAYIPMGLVHTAYVHPPDRQDAWFKASTSGLAVAGTRHDAVLHGLLECFERDALSRAQATHGFFQRRRIDPATIADRDLNDLLEKVEGAGLLAGLWQAEAFGGVPVIWCHLLEADSQSGTLIPFPAEGSAAGLDPARAACRAIREAAQARLAAISGAREDITRLSYPRYPDWDMIEAHRRLLRDGPRPMRFESLFTGTGEDWLARLLELGLSSILVVDLETAPFADLAAVKVLVPDLAPLDEA
ncbi:YcaO-like family protein [Nordella sp. HKS 07]|uniref:YcaO-like family protein n=1 Tax=Nordella sp. HKS 07 TaxID=2712222 RepID=UPI0013E1DA84|nr:YcaO-like family protein [Nordella sp. HKS 07]QIG48319.1 YcaO-like family protein [Nordella sp. HKS 07]